MKNKTFWGILFLISIKINAAVWFLLTWKLTNIISCLLGIGCLFIKGFVSEIHGALSRKANSF